MRVADTASRERGIDIVAEREAGTLAIEVKGFPSRGFADPRRVNEKKKAHPSAQATGWYGRAVLEAMLTWFGCRRPSRLSHCRISRDTTTSTEKPPNHWRDAGSNYGGCQGRRCHTGKAKVNTNYAQSFRYLNDSALS